MHASAEPGSHMRGWCCETFLCATTVSRSRRACCDQACRPGCSVCLKHWPHLPVLLPFILGKRFATFACIMAGGPSIIAASDLAHGAPAPRWGACHAPLLSKKKSRRYAQILILRSFWVHFGYISLFGGNCIPNMCLAVASANPKKGCFH